MALREEELGQKCLAGSIQYWFIMSRTILKSLVEFFVFKMKSEWDTAIMYPKPTLCKVGGFPKQPQGWLWWWWWYYWIFPPSLAHCQSKGWWVSMFFRSLVAVTTQYVYIKLCKFVFKIVGRFSMIVSYRDY